MPIIMVRELQPKVVVAPRSGRVRDFACAEGDEAFTGPIINTPWGKCLNFKKGGLGFRPKHNALSSHDMVRLYRR